MTVAAIIAAVTALATLVTTALSFIHRKTPEELERDRLAAEQEKRKESLDENRKAVENAQSGDTSDIEHRINQ